eukprot:gene22320-55969_t
MPSRRVHGVGARWGAAAAVAALVLAPVAPLEPWSRPAAAEGDTTGAAGRPTAGETVCCGRDWLARCPEYIAEGWEPAPVAEGWEEVPSPQEGGIAPHL